MAIMILVVLSILIAGTDAYGWGLMTHVELAESLITQATVLGAGIGSLLLRHRGDFVLGNLLADVIIGKKFSRRRKGCHDWSAGWRLVEHSHDDRARAFAYGFMTHLAADTVAHNDFVPRQIVRTGSSITLGHLYWELMADHLTHPSNRKMVRRLLREPARIHEELLEHHLHPNLKWFGLNRSIFVNLHRVTNGRKFNLAVRLCREWSMFPLQHHDVSGFKLQALERMMDILSHGKRSSLLREDPNGSQALKEIHDRRRLRA